MSYQKHPKRITMVRFADLRERGIVSNWSTLSRWIKSGHFPKPIKLGPNTTVWPEPDIDDFVDKCRDAGERG